ncbi:RNA-directed DNA polymerase, eukaryota, reverse transcriptase zinc-binding domain protein, partial [Tanacetum coccineum]
DLVNEVQSAFVADRQILDGPFILNELFQWCKSKKKQSLIFKVDFEKAYDSGDPLSPFLFILIMESLHVSFQKVVDACMFKGIALGPSMQVSHMFYADDAVFVGQWRDFNIDTIVKVLECFYCASGLRINMSKSKLMGISVNEEKIAQAALKIGCAILKAPFSYLGSKVGGLMSRIQSWNEIVESMIARLSKWKMKTLSIGGRLTLLKSVLGSMSIYHMSIFKVPMKVLQRMESIRCHFFNGADLSGKKSIWVKWNSALASKEKGGLAIHGEDGKIGKYSKVAYPSLWLDIVHEMELFTKKDIDIFSCMHKKLGNGANTAFWEDVWRGDVAFKHKYPRLYALETCKGVDVAAKLAHTRLVSSFRREPRGGVEHSQLVDLLATVEGVVLVDMRDMWVWSLEGSGEFTVASVRKWIDDKRLPEVSTKTRWIKAMPIKVNVHAWKVRLDCLPTRLNISRRGMDIDSILCPICDNAVESSRHIFFN